jgi:hypothetical protein
MRKKYAYKNDSRSKNNPKPSLSEARKINSLKKY